MKNKANDLRNHLFAALERLNDENIKEEDLRNEISRAQAVAEIGKVLVDSAKTAVLYAKIKGSAHQLKDEDYLPEEKPVIPLQRPPAEYSNTRSQYGLTGGE